MIIGEVGEDDECVRQPIPHFKAYFHNYPTQFPVLVFCFFVQTRGIFQYTAL